MGMTIPIPLRMTDDRFITIIQEIAKKTERVKFSRHAKKRMKERGFTSGQVYTCLRRGVIYEPVHQDVRGDHKCTLRHLCAGDDVRVAVALKKDNRGCWIAILTVY